MDKKKVFVRNIPFDCTKEDLEALFGEIGPVTYAFIATDKRNGRPRGFGFVEYGLEIDAQKAVESLNGHELKGRPISLDIAASAGFKHTQTTTTPSQGKRSRTDAEETPVKRMKTENDESPKVEEQEDKGKKTASNFLPELRSVVLGWSGDSTMDWSDVESRCRSLGNVYSIERGTHVSGQTVELRSKAAYAGRYGVPLKPKPQREVHIIDPALSHFAIVVYSKMTEALEAAKELDQSLFGGVKISAHCIHALDEHRLIVRSLSFKATLRDVEARFGAYGPLVEVHAPDKTSSFNISRKHTYSHPGFCFVQFVSPVDAALAMKEVNGTDIMGRPAAVDLALRKTEHALLAKAQSSPEEAVKSEEKEAEDGEQADGEADATEGKKLSRNKLKRLKQKERKKAKKALLEGAKQEEEEEGEASDDENGEAKADVKMEEDEAEEAAEETAVKKEEKGSGSDAGGEESEGQPKEKKARNRKKKESALETVEKLQGREESDKKKTVFLRNVPIFATDEQLKERMSEFGQVTMCLVVRDKTTGSSKGTAFVKFAEEAGAEKVLEVSEQNFKLETLGHTPGTAIIGGASLGGIPFLDTRLQPSRAVSREESQKIALDRIQAKKSGITGSTGSSDSTLKSSSSKAAGSALMPVIDPNDPRNLHLALEGMVTSTSAAAKTMKPEDLARFEAAAQAKKKRLAKGDKDMFVSTVRLSVRNMPKSFTEEQLREVMLDAASLGNPDKKGKPQIKQLKIEVDRKDASQSKGYGFVQFTEHADALRALRNVVSGRGLAGKVPGGRRLLCEFAVQKVSLLRQLEAKVQHAHDRDPGLHARDDAAASKPAKGKKEKKAPASADDQKPKESKKALAKRKREDDTQSILAQLPPKKEEGPSKKQRKRAQDQSREDKVDALVEKYRKNLFQDPKTVAEESSGSSRWFE